MLFLSDWESISINTVFNLPLAKASQRICVILIFHEREYVGPDVITDKVVGLLSIPTSRYTNKIT